MRSHLSKQNCVHCLVQSVMDCHPISQRQDRPLSRVNRPESLSQQSIALLIFVSDSFRLNSTPTSAQALNSRAFHHNYRSRGPLAKQNEAMDTTIANLLASVDINGSGRPAQLTDIGKQCAISNQS